MSGLMIVPSALIQASGFEDLPLSTLRLVWRIIDRLCSPELGDSAVGMTVRLPTAELLEAGEDKRARLIARLDQIRMISIKANLDGRDNAEIWRFNLALVAEYEFKNEWVEVSVGPRMYTALRNRAIYAKVRESVLFNMRSSKYSSLLYTLICDKANLKHKQFEVDIDEFRRLMQIKDGSYSRFDHFKDRVIDTAIREINEEAEITVSWSKGRTYKNKVRTILFTWKKKTTRELVKIDDRRHQPQETADAPPLFTQKETVAAAVHAWRGLKGNFAAQRAWSMRAALLLDKDWQSLDWGKPLSWIYIIADEIAKDPWDYPRGFDSIPSDEA